MIKLKIFFSIFLLFFFMSCKQNNQKDQTVTLSKSKTDNDILKNTPSNLKIENHEKIDIDNSIENKTSASAVQQIIEDLDGDGIKDKIEVYKNSSLKDKFDQEHFNLPVKIFKGTKNGFELWKENNNLVYSPDNTCVSEGFGNIVVKDNYFTIEAQTCYDYNVLVDGFITFKVENNEIYLYKYGEEYFDKSNHDKKIPSKVWTQKNFNKIKFQDVNELFLRKLKTSN